MAMYQQVSYGSSGAAVRQLQTALNERGYSLDVDGAFGTKTRAAVRDYQKKNGLLLDGIAGDQTWGSLMSSPAAAAVEGEPVYRVSSDTTAALQQLEQGYTPSADVSAAADSLSAAQALRPADYESDFSTQLSALYEEISGREAFSYDPSADPTYQAYAAQYARMGRSAMEDTLGRASGLTGGYTSSYAQSAAQQSYNGYLQQLSQVTPALQSAAYDRYRQEGESLLDRYELLQGQDKEAYDRWQDEVSVWQKAVSEERSGYESLRDDDLKNYQLLLNYFSDKAATEAKGLPTAAGTASALSSIGNRSSLSSTGAESLEKAANNYLKAGQTDKAAALLQSYKSRMTAAQKTKFASLFAACGL